MQAEVKGSGYMLCDWFYELLLHNVEMMTSLTRRLLGALMVVVAAACGADEKNSVSLHSSETDQKASQVTASSLGRDGPLIVVLGDSLTAGLGLDVDQAYPTVLERQLHQDGYEVSVVNAGVSGDTSAGGLSRVEWALEGDVRILVVALGGNDGLRGLPTSQMKENLSGIVSQARRRGVEVVLAGMEAPPNLGASYAREFREVFIDLAQTYDLVFLPFLLAGVAAEPLLNQADGIHPNARGAAIVAERVRETIEPLLSDLTVSTP